MMLKQINNRSVSVLDFSRPSSELSRHRKRRTGETKICFGISFSKCAQLWPNCFIYVCVCVWRALPVMFAVALDLRIFANNVRNWLLLEDWVFHSVIVRLCVLCVCLCVCLSRPNNSCRRRIKVNRVRCWRKQQNIWWAASEYVPATSQCWQQYSVKRKVSL